MYLKDLFKNNEKIFIKPNENNRKEFLKQAKNEGFNGV